MSATYRRSWKNLLLNKQYQLRFTLFMVGLAALLMALLGWWVVGVAGEATRVAQSLRRGEPCPPAPTSVYLADDAAMAAPAAMPAPMPAPPAPATQPTVPEPPPPPADVPAADPTPADLAPAHRPADPSGEPGDDGHRRVIVHESTLTMEAPPPPKLDPAYDAKVKAHDQCELARQAAIDELGRGKTRIVWVLIASSLALLIGLALFGIKMTHRVAGPLHKITLYFAKLRDGRYDRVTDLRKGDQLVEFFDHFKQAHAGVVDLERADLSAIKAALAAAEADGSLARSPELAEAAAALRAIAERKEKALG